MKSQHGEVSREKASLVLWHDRVVRLSIYSTVYVQLNQPHIQHTLYRGMNNNGKQSNKLVIAAH